MKLLVLVLLLVQDPTVDQLIRQLGADDVDDRNQATHELRKRGIDMLPRLREAAESKDAEVVARAREVLGLILEDFGQSTLRSFEHALDKAPSLVIYSRASTPKDPTVRFTGQGRLLRKPGGKIRITSEGVVSDETWNALLVSDGERMMLETQAGRSGQRDWGYDGKDYWPTVRAAAARVAVLNSAHIWAYVRIEETPIAELFVLGTWKQGAEGKLRTLEYSISWRGKESLPVPNPTHAKVWYDPTTFRPIKRLLTFSFNKAEPQVLEQFDYETDISENVLRVPEGK
jgi:hypothetical protein